MSNVKTLLIKGIIILGLCILIFYIIQYIFILNESFENNSSNASNTLIIDKRHRITFNKIDDEYIQYISKYVKSNSIESLCIKMGLANTKENKYNDLMQKYKEHLVPFSNAEKNKLKELIQEIIQDPKFNRGHNSKYAMFISKFNTSMKWNLLKTRNLELNLPCTVSKYILFPETDLKKKNWSHIKETLMHEQIHIIQRQHQDIFNNEYKNIFNHSQYANTTGYEFTLLPIQKNLIDYSAIDIEYIQIQNPDEDDMDWLIYDNHLNNYYVVPYIIHRSNINTNKASDIAETTSDIANTNTNTNTKTKNMPHVSTQKAFVVDMNKNNGPHTYVVTGNKIDIQELEYFKYLQSISGYKYINIAHPNETFTDLFLNT